MLIGPSHFLRLPFQMDSCTDEGMCREVECIDALTEAGFTKVFNMDTKETAILALKQHYGFYKFLPAIRQFMSG